jgi:hypothetical protein
LNASAKQIEGVVVNYTGANQAVVDLDFNATHNMPGPFRMVVRGFSRYAETVGSLPLLERIKLAIVTDFVVDSFLPGNLPIVGMRLIGHADTDPDRERREPGSVKRISEKRAAEIERYLKRDVGVRAWMSRLGKDGPNPDKIHWDSSGVGSSQPDEENVKRKKTHANMTEQDRKLNRRVRIFLEPGSTPVPQPTDPGGILGQAMKQWVLDMRLKYPPGRWHPWPWIPGPVSRDEYTKFKCSVLEQLKKFDVDTAVSTLKDMILKDPSETSDWTNSLRQLVDEVDKRRKESEKEWWRDEDCGQQPPAPSKKFRLLVEPRIVNLKQGGQAKVKVTAVARPEGKPIELELKNPPPEVTMDSPRRFIPSYEPFVRITLIAAPDAPVGTTPSVFFYGYVGGGVALNSDMFTVTVQ